MKSTMGQLGNKYAEMKAEFEAKKEVLLSRLKKVAKNMQDASAKMNMGDDGKVDEAVLISFFAALYGDTANAYQAFRELYLQNKLNANEEMQDRLQQKIDRLKDFQEANKRIQRYTALNIEKSKLQQKLDEPGLTANEQRNHESRLSEVMGNMKEISAFYGYESDRDFLKELERSEQKWYGEDGAEVLKELRGLTPETESTVLGGAIDPDDLLRDSELSSEVVNRVMNGLADSRGMNLLQEMVEEAESKNVETRQDLS